jgi:hypothetical protein
MREFFFNKAKDLPFWLNKKKDLEVLHIGTWHNQVPRNTKAYSRGITLSTALAPTKLQSNASFLIFSMTMIVVEA